MDYFNLTKSLGPKKAMEALSMVKEIRGKKTSAKAGVDLVSMTKRLAEKRLEEEKNEKNSEEE